MTSHGNSDIPTFRHIGTSSKFRKLFNFWPHCEVQISTSSAIKKGVEFLDPDQDWHLLRAQST